MWGQEELERYSMKFGLNSFDPSMSAVDPLVILVKISLFPLETSFDFWVSLTSNIQEIESGISSTTDKTPSYSLSKTRSREDR